MLWENFYLIRLTKTLSRSFLQSILRIYIHTFKCKWCVFLEVKHKKRWGYKISVKGMKDLEIYVEIEEVLRERKLVSRIQKWEKGLCRCEWMKRGYANGYLDVGLIMHVFMKNKRVNSKEGKSILLIQPSFLTQKENVGRWKRYGRIPRGNNLLDHYNFSHQEPFLWNPAGEYRLNRV